MATSDCFVSVLAPLRDDADIVEAYVAETLAVLRREYANYELVLVDDGSRDDTTGRVEALLRSHECVRLIRLSRRFGEEIAIAAGLDSVIGDFVVVMMPDTDPPALIPAMIERCRSGTGAVSGVRVGTEEGLLQRLGSWMLHAYLRRLLKIGVPRNCTNFHVLSRQAVNAITRIKDRVRLLKLFVSLVGYGRETFEYAPIRRRDQPRRRRFDETVVLAANLLVGASTMPLQFGAVLSFVIGLGSAARAVRIAVLRAIGSPGGGAPLFEAIAFTVVFFILMVVCLYLGRLIGDMRDRPLYWVRDERNSSVLIANEQRKNVVTDSSRE
jgi:glycosyltransferase involved in cell wall biosynthesis